MTIDTAKLRATGTAGCGCDGSGVLLHIDGADSKLVLCECNPVTRDALGAAVREVWIDWAVRQPNPKPSWLVGWEDLAESDREVDRMIGEALFTRGVLEAAALVRDGADETWDHELVMATQRAEAAAHDHAKAIAERDDAVARIEKLEGEVRDHYCGALEPPGSYDLCWKDVGKCERSIGHKGQCARSSLDTAIARAEKAERAMSVARRHSDDCARVQDPSGGAECDCPELRDAALARVAELEAENSSIMRHYEIEGDESVRGVLERTSVAAIRLRDSKQLLLSELKALREALQPFADCADKFDSDGWSDDDSAPQQLTIGHLRDARKALKKADPDGS